MPEEAANAREEFLLIRQIDHHLQPRAVACEARLDHRVLALNPEIEMPRVPGDFVRGVALEINAVEPLPQLLFRAVGHRVESELAQRLGATRLEAVLQTPLTRPPGEVRLGRVEKILQKLGLPRVPDPRAGAPNVSDGQQIKREQTALGRYLCRNRSAPR